MEQAMHKDCLGPGTGQKDLIRGFNDQGLDIKKPLLYINIHIHAELWTWLKDLKSSNQRILRNLRGK
jgi:hypothetical protein